MKDDDRINARQMHELACRMRGNFINGTAWIEVLLTDILSHYFCAEKHRRMLFFSDVADSMNFRSKIGLLRKILEHEGPELSADHPKLADRLDTFREFRNILAHNHLDTSEASIAKRKPDEVLFVIYRRSQMGQRRVTTKEANDRAEEANKLRQELLSLQKRLFRGD